MKKLLAAIRKIPFINYPVRTFLRAGSKLFDKLSSHWTTSGIITIAYEDVKLKVFNKCDDGFVQTFYYNKNYWESNLLTITDAFAKESNTILDIGANTGIDSIIIAKKNPGVNIIAIEPYEPNYSRLEKNIILNRISNIRLEKVALGNKEDILELTVPADGRISDVASAEHGIGQNVYPTLKWKKINIPQITLNSLNLPEVKFFKCDVEGFEVNVFDGAFEFIEKYRPSFIVEILSNKMRIDYFNNLAQKYGYTIYFLSSDGLVRLDKLYEIDWRGDFLFTTYRHAHTFIPSKDLGAFVKTICNSMSNVLTEHSRI